MQRIKPPIARFLLGALVLTGVGCRPVRPADLVLRSVAVYTMSTPDTAEAVAIRAGRIVYVGNNAGADRLIGDSTEVLDLAGRMVMPSFRDTHVHPQSEVALDEWQRGSPVPRQLAQRTEAELREGIRRALAIANGFGITAVHDASVGPEALAVYAALDRDGELTARVVAAQPVDPNNGLDQIDSLVARRKRFAGTRYFQPDAAKLYADGVIEAGTAALLEPYTGSDSRGDANFRQGQLDSLVTALDRAGIQIHIHAIGDRAVRSSLDAIERARGSRQALRKPPILAHIQLIDSADIPRFASLGVVAGFQPLWAHADEYTTRLTEPVLGPDRSRRLYPIGSVAGTGALIAAGSDWSVSSLNPLDAIQTALTRLPLEAGADSAWLPTERVDLTTVLRAYTINGARAAGDEKRTGSLEIGKAADLIVVDRNLYRIPAGQIHQARVLLTLLDGQSVYRDRALR